MMKQTANVWIQHKCFIRNHPQNADSDSCLFRLSPFWSCFSALLCSALFCSALCARTYCTHMNVACFCSFVRACISIVCYKHIWILYSFRNVHRMYRPLYLLYSPMHNESSSAQTVVVGFYFFFRVSPVSRCLFLLLFRRFSAFILFSILYFVLFTVKYLLYCLRWFVICNENNFMYLFAEQKKYFSESMIYYRFDTFEWRVFVPSHFLRHRIGPDSVHPTCFSFDRAEFVRFCGRFVLV